LDLPPGEVLRSKLRKRVELRKGGNFALELDLLKNLIVAQSY